MTTHPPERIYNPCPTHTLLTGAREYVLIHIMYSLQGFTSEYEGTHILLYHSWLILLNWRVLIATCKQLVWSIRIGWNMPIWVLLRKETSGKSTHSRKIILGPGAYWESVWPGGTSRNYEKWLKNSRKSPKWCSGQTQEGWFVEEEDQGDVHHWQRNIRPVSWSHGPG
jgi:hypothetical protein